MSRHGGGVIEGDIWHPGAIHEASGNYRGAGLVASGHYPLGAYPSAWDMKPKQEEHADRMRHLLLKRLPAFKADWSDAVKIAWLEAITKLWEAETS